MADPRGATIGGRYALCGEIASGGMATVHIARQVGAAGFARIVAVKRLHERYSRDPEFVAMFLDEARLVARIRHPNVIQTIDVVAEEGELFLVMEYVHGESLLRLTRTASHDHAVLPVPVLAGILASALHGLHEAHEALGETGEPLGIVHRDVSPHNILVGADGVTRVLDFGVAKASQRIQTTQEGHLKGKLSYMAPEQIRNSVVDRRTDVYAASVVLWEALTGRKLFHAENEAAVLIQILHDPIPSPASLNPSIPPALDAVVRRGLARDPSERFATAREMALAIERATPCATASEVGALVAKICEKSISERARIIATVEMNASSSNLRDAVDGLRSLASSSGAGGEASNLAGGSGVRGHTNAPPPYVLGSNPTLLSQSSNVTPGPQALASSMTDRAGDQAGAGARLTGRGSPFGVGSPRVIAAVACSGALIMGLLSVSTYVLFAKGKAVDRTSTTPSATRVAADGDGGRNSVHGVATASCPDGMAMVAESHFFMGSKNDLPEERPEHGVKLHAYCMDKLEVTTDAYLACSERGGCPRPGLTNDWEGITAKDSRTFNPLCNARDASRGRHPINCVDWTMANEFCKAEGKRLPTEAEWEFAARGLGGYEYPWGKTPPTFEHFNACGAECVAWGRKHGAPLEALFKDGRDPWETTAPVGSFPKGAAPGGIQDLLGNVWEWTADVFGSYSEAEAVDPTGPPADGTTPVLRVLRGGAWNGGNTGWLRPSFRYRNAPTMMSYGVGFRCAKAL